MSKIFAKSIIKFVNFSSISPGNLYLHIITNSGFYEARFDLEDWDGNKGSAEYCLFHVNDSTTNYRLTISGYTSPGKH